jgi:xanthine dehydrogenase accessory factor
MIRGEIAGHAQHLVADREPFVLATVVHARHPTSVHPGDSAIVLPDGKIEGFVGGVCAESSVRLHGLRVLETGEPLLLRLVPGDPETGERAEHADPPDGAVVEQNPCLSGGSLEIFLEPQLPALRIAVVGRSPIAQAVEEVARAAGYAVASGAADEVCLQDGDAALIVASHGSDEERVLSEALAAGVPYVALVASKARGAAVRAALDVPDGLRGQLHTPAGLDIGARTPAEIAISILAELVAEHRANPGRGARPLELATDPVCGMKVAVSAETPSLDSAGRRVFFCGEGCRSAYAEQHARDVAAR